MEFSHQALMNTLPASTDQNLMPQIMADNLTDKPNMADIPHISDKNGG